MVGIGAVEDVARALQVSVGLLRRQLRAHPVQDDVSPPEMSALAWLDREGARTAADLARREGISPQSMGATLAGLESTGLIERTADADDGRRILLSLTDAGRNLLRVKRTARTEQLAAVLAAEFSPDDIEALRVAAPLIERLARSL